MSCQKTKMMKECYDMSVDREGLILNYRLGNKKQYSNQCLIRVIDTDPSDAMQLIGSKVGWPADDAKIFGTIVSQHGKKGVLRVRFKTGMPGQALSTRVRIFT
jgi:ribosomal protein L35AE/L33A